MRQQLAATALAATAWADSPFTGVLEKLRRTGEVAVDGAGRVGAVAPPRTAALAGKERARDSLICHPKMTSKPVD